MLRMIGAFIAKRKIRSGFAAMACGDLDALLSVFADDATLFYPIKGTMQGKAAIRAFYEHFLQVFPKVVPTVHHICVNNLLDVVGTNVIATHWDVATTNRRGTTYSQTGVHLIETHMGRITSMRYFFADPDQLKQAWKESE